MPNSAKVLSQDPMSGEEVRRPDLSDYMAAGMEKLGIETNHVALDWDVDPSYVGKVLKGEKPLADYRIAQLPKALQREIVYAWCVDLQLLVGRKVALTTAIEGLIALMQDDEPPRKRMAKAALDESVMVRHA